jgi:hypothetical protein
MTEQTWALRAKHLLEQALAEIRDGVDAIPTVSAALAALRIEVGELPASELADLVVANAVCVCPPDLLSRGGFRGCCPARHAHTEVPAAFPLGEEATADLCEDCNCCSARECTSDNCPRNSIGDSICPCTCP